MTDENEKTVEIGEDAEKSAKNSEQGAEPAQEQSKTGAESDELADLKRQIDEHRAAVARERQARVEAERQAREFAEKAQNLDTSARDDRLTAIENAIQVQKTIADRAERDMADAMASGDYAAAAKAQREMSGAEAKLVQLGNGKAAIEETIEESRKSPKHEFKPTERDPIEAWIETLPPASAQWMQKHRHLAADQAMLQRIGTAANAAVQLEGLVADTPEYFDYIETKLGLRTKPNGQATEQNEPLSRNKRPIPAAPVSGPAASSGMAGQRMTLSPAMQEMAHNLYPDLAPDEAEKQYAIHRHAMIKAGRITA